MKFGVHVSIQGGFIKALDRAVARDCELLQVFSQPPRGWVFPRVDEREARNFKKLLKEKNLTPLVLHAPYLLNLASPSFSLRLRSAWSLIAGAEVGEKLGASYLVFHPGSSREAPLKVGLKNLIDVLEYVLSRSRGNIIFLIENTAASGHLLASSFRQIGEVLKAFPHEKRLGVCFDTAHALASGYNLSSEEGFYQTIREMEKSFGLEKVKLIHANDSHYPVGSARDRHAHIGEGYITLGGFKRLVNFAPFQEIPCILETPRMSLEDDLRNLSTIRSLVESVSAEQAG